MDIKQRLREIGFKYIGSWIKKEKNQLLYELTYASDVNNVLYAFVSDEELLYLGKTTQNLSNRFKGYIMPGISQTTNIRNNYELIKLLNLNKIIEIWLFEDRGLMSYGGFQVNLAAGLEDSLIRELKPKWNGRRLKQQEKQIINLNIELNESPMQQMPRYELTLHTTYYNWNCINISGLFSQFLGEDKQAIEIYVEDEMYPIDIAKIDRQANKGSSVRIRPDGSKNLKQWFHKNLKLLDVVSILY